MGRLEDEARNEREKLHEKRKTIYSSLPYQSFMIHAVKTPLIESIQNLTSPSIKISAKVRALLRLRSIVKNFEHFPEPQKGVHPDTGLPYVWHPNSIRLIEIRDEFFRHCFLSESRLKLIRAAINFAIIIYDYDFVYRKIIDWWAKGLKIPSWDFEASKSLIQREYLWWKEN